MDRRRGMLRQLSQFSMRRLGVSRRNLIVAVDDDEESVMTVEQSPSPKAWVPAPRGIADCNLTKNHHAELGRVRFRFTGDSYDQALAYAADTDKPILAIFQEIPGCPESIAFGQTVLSHPLLVEAAETLFVPLMVNTAGTSGNNNVHLVSKYKELRHHSTMVRILNEKGSDLVLNLADTRCTIGNIAKAMRMALDTNVLKVPAYLRILETEYAAAEEEHDHGCVGSRKRARVVAFRINDGGVDAHLAETHFAELKGVLGTETGTMARRHNNVVKVTYNSDIIDCTAVVRQALFHHDVTAVYYGDKSNFLPIQTEFDKLDATSAALLELDENKFRPDTCQKKHFLQRTLYRYVPLTTLQLTMVNFALSRHMDANAILSPRQLAILEAVETKRPRRNVVNVEVTRAWNRLESDGVYNWQ